MKYVWIIVCVLAATAIFPVAGLVAGDIEFALKLWLALLAATSVAALSLMACVKAAELWDQSDE